MSIISAYFDLFIYLLQLHKDLFLSGVSGSYADETAEITASWCADTLLQMDAGIKYSTLLIIHSHW